MDPERAALLAALALQCEFGADEALEIAPVDRTASIASSVRLLDPVARAVPAAAAADDPPSRMPAGAAQVANRAEPPPLLARAMALAAAAGSLDALRAAIAAFDGGGLRDIATSMVFADGVVGAKLMVIGDVPGDAEDRAGRPFVGPPGQLLDRMLGSIGLRRERDVYLTDLLNYRTPGGRAATPAEIALFLPFLRRHIALAAPARLLLLGGAARPLLGAGEAIQRLRSRWFQVTIDETTHIPALPMRHPAHLIGAPNAKRDAWADLLRLRAAMAADAGTGSTPSA